MEDDKVLLIQEADPSIKGLWYLPAGLVDPNETIAVRSISYQLIKRRIIRMVYRQPRKGKLKKRQE